MFLRFLLSAMIFIIIFATQCFALPVDYWNNGFIKDKKQFYNLEYGVFKIYGNSLNDVKFSFGSQDDIVLDYKILNNQILFLTGWPGNGYCSSYSLQSFKQNFKVKCDVKRFITSPNEKYFTNEQPITDDCYVGVPAKEIPIYSLNDGHKVHTVSSACGGFIFGLGDKAYTFEKSKTVSSNLEKISLIEVDILTGQSSALMPDFNSEDVSLEYIRNPQIAWNGHLLGFNARLKTFHDGHIGASDLFYVFDLDKGTHEIFSEGNDGTGFITNSGFFRTDKSDMLKVKSGNLININRYYLGCVSDYCRYSFSSMNDEVLYSSGGANYYDILVAKYNSQTSKIDFRVIPTSPEMTSAYNSKTIEGKNNIYYLDYKFKLFILDTNTMNSRLFLDDQSQGPSSHIYTSDDQKVVLLWSWKKSIRTLSFYDADSSTLIAEKTFIEGNYDCSRGISDSALSVKVSSYNRQAIFKCSSDGSIGLVNF